MAFRSELEAAQHRAEAAEAEAQRLRLELSSQSARMDRVAEIEGQLEAARAKLREQGPRSQAVATVTGAVAVVALAGSLWYLSVRGDDDAGAAHETAAEDAEAVRRANAAEDTARLELTMMTTERDDALAALATASDEVRTVLRAFGDAPSGAAAADYPIHFGRVVTVSGTTPIRAGARCDVVASDDGGCGGAIRCGEVTVHTFGCRGRARSELRTADPYLMVIDPAWRVTIDTMLTR